QMRQARRNPFGFDREYWRKFGGRIVKSEGSETDAQFEMRMDASVGWSDLELMLRALREVGARPVVLGAPLAGTYFDALGVSAAARRQYYERLARVSLGSGVPILTFADHDQNLAFFADGGSHPSEAGWTYLDEALDAFWHAAG